MKILWVNSHFLHPATSGGQTRTLEMLRHLSRWHEVHFVAFEHNMSEADQAKSEEYCSRAYAIRHRAAPQDTASFAMRALGNLVDPLPLAIAQYRSEGMKREVLRLLETGRFDRLVCDNLFTAPNVPALHQALLFEHRIETVVWDQYVQDARSRPARLFFRMQRNRMARYEGEACRRSAHVVAVSEEDAQRCRKFFRAERVSEVPTGVDVPAFARPVRQEIEPKADLVFVGSMNWLPNVDGCNYFVREILPLIREKRPDCTVAFVGHSPGSGLLEMARADSKICVTGRVPDIRPYLWGGKVSIVPIRIFGGTRLKIFEAMAAQVPVVSTATGAEGLPVTHGRGIYLANSAEDFAQGCLELLNSEERRRAMAQEGFEMASARFSWEHAARVFESTLEQEAPLPRL